MRRAWACLQAAGARQLSQLVGRSCGDASAPASSVLRCAHPAAHTAEAACGWTGRTAHARPFPNGLQTRGITHCSAVLRASDDRSAKSSKKGKGRGAGEGGGAKGPGEEAPASKKSDEGEQEGGGFMTAREKYPGLPNLVMHEEDSQPPRPLKELPDWVEMEAAFMAAQDPLNPFNYFRFTGSDIGEPDEDLDDRAGDFEIRLPGNLRSEVSFEDMMAADAPRLRKILNIKSDPERRKQLKLFLKERLFIQPIPLTEPRAPRRQLKMVVLAQSMVTKVTKGGGVMRARVLVAVGDGCNRVGLAEAKANRMLSAVDKAYRAASRNLVRVPKFMLQTIREPVRAKQTASIVEMSPAYQDRGHRCSETIGMLCRLAGVNNVRAKVHRSQNRFNSAKAAFKCLQRLSDSFEQELKAYSPDRRAALLETAYNPEPAPNPRAPGGAGGDAESGQGLVGREDWSHMSEHLPGGAEGRAEPAERLASQLSA